MRVIRADDEAQAEQEMAQAQQGFGHQERVCKSRF